MTIVAIVKCKNGYIALIESEQAHPFNGTQPVTQWLPDTAHVFTDYPDLVEWLYSIFDVHPLEEKPA